MKATWRLPSARETESLGVALARNCPWDEREPRLVFLSGELGAGKTTLAAALLQALGVEESVRSPSSLRTGATCFIAPWWRGAKRKPMPHSSMQAATAEGASSTSTPRAVSTSALPHLEETARLPCLATRAPPATATKAAVVEMLKVCEPSPPVPQVSMSRSCETSTRTARDRSDCAAPAISSGVSPFIRSATRSAAICEGGTPPSSIASRAAADCARVRSWPSTASLICSRSGI